MRSRLTSCEYIIGVTKDQRNFKNKFEELLAEMEARDQNRIKENKRIDQTLEDFKAQIIEDLNLSTSIQDFK